MALVIRRCPRCEHAASGPPGVRCPVDGAALLDPRLLPVQPELHPLLGEVVADKYAVVDVLGSGGMGTVYEAVQAPLGRIVALKVMRADRAAPARSRARFFAEAQRAAQLASPHVVSVFDYGEDARTGQRFIVLERVRGPTLADVLAGGPLPAARATRIAVHVLGALDEAHGMGLVHGDVKPANIVLATGADGGDHAMLLDFGVARMVADPDAGDGRAGTPAYMAPEHIRGEGIGPAADQYAVGCVLLEMLTGARPFPGERPWDVMSAHLGAPPPPTPGATPAGVAAAVSRAMAKAPGARFPDVRAMARALDPRDEERAAPRPATQVRRSAADGATITATDPAGLPIADVLPAEPRGRRRAVGWSLALVAAAAALVLPGETAERAPPTPRSAAGAPPQTPSRATPGSTPRSTAGRVEPAPAADPPRPPDRPRRQRAAPAAPAARPAPPAPLITIPPGVH